MPWRTEPDIDGDRQTHLAQRRAVTPDIERGIYPFRDERGGIALTRADVEWLLATHEGGGTVGPVAWEAERGKPGERRRAGLDLRGADLRGLPLAGLPLGRLRAGLAPDEWYAAGEAQREWAAAHLEGAVLVAARLEGADLNSVHLEGAVFLRELRVGRHRAAHLEEADLRGAHLQGADLRVAHLEGAVFREAHLEGKRLTPDEWERVRGRVADFPAVLPPANLQRAFFDATTTLDEVALGSRHFGFVSLADVRWGGANLAVVRWDEPRAGRRRRAAEAVLGEEMEARRARAATGARKPRARRLDEFATAVRAYRQLSTVLRGQGLNEQADRFAYRAQLCQREMLRRRGKLLRFLGSFLLDATAGYGYRPARTLLWYLAGIGGFALAYFWATRGVLTLGLPPSRFQPLPWYEALVLSISSFHGRGFLPFPNLGDPVTILAAAEAVFGLFIEVSFIATFTQRYFGK